MSYIDISGFYCSIERRLSAMKIYKNGLRNRMSDDFLADSFVVHIEKEMSSENGVNTPAPNPSPNSSFSLLSVLGRERLTGPNYMDWMRNLRFTLRYDNKEYVLDEQIPIIDNDSTQEEIEAY
ncbi:hypothetical protein Tco_0564628 [Tanacetum coccineum]